MKKCLILLLLPALLLSACGKADNNSTNNTNGNTTGQINYSQLTVTAISKLTEDDISDFYTLFDSNLKKTLSEQDLKTTWAQLKAKMGDFQYYSSNFTVNTINNDKVVDVPCVFKNGTVILRLTFNDSGKISGFFLMDSTKDDAKLISPRLSNDHNVTIGQSPWQLPGSLTLPEGKGPFPVVILVHGSGPSDRNEQIGPNLPFLNIAHDLSQQGIATLRYDKRTYVYGAEMAALTDLTVQDETLDDVVAAVNLLKTSDNIDPKRIYIAGHSLGGTLIPRLAPLTPDVAGYIMLAGSPRAMEDLVLEQTEYILSTQAEVEYKTKNDLLMQTRATVDRIKSLTSSSTLTADQLMGTPVSYWLDLKAHDPISEITAINKPLLILQGGRDYQVTKVDYDLWQNALSYKDNVHFRYYSNLNHLFMAGVGKSKPTEYQTQGLVSTDVTNDMAAFIKGLS